MVYSFDPIFAADPSNAANVAANASILIFDPADAGKAPITITDVTGAALPNPITVNKNGFGPAFQHATLDRVGWFGAGFENYFTSYEGMKNVATDAQSAAEAAQAAAETAGVDAAAEAASALAGAVADAEAAQAAAETAAALVGAPADAAVETLINATGSATRVKLDTTFAAKSVETSKQDVATIDAAVTAKINDGASATRGALNATYAPASLSASVAGKLDTTAARGAYVAQLPAAARLFGALAARNTTPARLAFAGSSTTEGVGASVAGNRWVNQFVTAVQAAYPSSTGTETAVVASTSATWGTLSTAPGVHGYNAGQGGTASDNYLVSGELANINALNPAAVFHMVGSNDFDLGYTPAFVKSQVQSKIATLKGYANATPCVHVLVQSYERFDKTTHTYPWADYATVLREIAEEDPANVIFIDLSGVFTALGIPAADPLDVINADAIHPTDAGHTLLADSVRRALGIAVKTASSAAQLVSTRLTSDIASGANVGDVIGRTTDALLGGAGKVWAGDPTTSVAITSNAFVRGATVNNFTAVIVEPVADVELSAVVNALPVGDSLIMDIHRVLSTVSGSPNAYRLYIAPTTGALTLSKRISGAVTNLATGATCAIGDRVAIRYYRGTLEARVNGKVLMTATDATVPAAGFAGLSGTAALTSFSMKSIALDAIT